MNYKTLDQSQIINLIQGLQVIQDPKSCYEYNGRMVPRVTRILSKCISDDRLLYWANNLGLKGQYYSAESKLAMNIGTTTHESIDTFLENGSNPDFIQNDKKTKIQEGAAYAYASFMLWWRNASVNNTIEVVLKEHKLICDLFGGTLDGLYKINGKYYIIDYKTSKNIDVKYFMQLAAYRYLLRTLMNIEVDGFIILQISKSSIGYNEYFLNFAVPEHLLFANECERCFFALVYSYYNILHIDAMYKEVDWNGYGTHSYDCD